MKGDMVLWRRRHGLGSDENIPGEHSSTWCSVEVLPYAAPVTSGRVSGEKETETETERRKKEKDRGRRNGRS